jgi:hypothetical protein
VSDLHDNDKRSEAPFIVVNLEILRVGDRAAARAQLWIAIGPKLATAAGRKRTIS